MCSHPIRLKGRINAIDLATGELRPMYDTATEPGGVLLTACGNRRETVCPACSAVYKRDARQLVRAGLTGGKGVPDTIAAPSVRVRHPHRPLVRPGPLPAHARQDRAALPTPPRSPGPPLPARPRHLLPPPPRRGRPPARPGAVPATATTTTPPSCSTPTPGTCGAGSPPTCPATWPACLGITQKRLRAVVRIRYVKVAEYQARGVVHFHAIIRLDAPGDDYQPPPPGFTADLLCEAIRQAAAAVALTVAPGPATPTAQPGC